MSGHIVSTITLLAAAALVCGPAAAGETASGIYRGWAVTYHLMTAPTGSNAVFEGDILLDHVQAIPDRAGHTAPASHGVAYAQYLWPKNTQGVAEIPYTVTSAAPQLNAAISAFNTTFTGVIQFVTRSSQADYVDFNFDANNFSGQCESYVGHVGGAQTVSGSASCNLGTLLHEMGHVTGLYHEQTRADRDSFITINTGNVIKGSLDNFTQLGDNSQSLALFDYASAMEYIPFAFSRNGGDVIESIPPGIRLSSLTGYSAGDIDSIKRLYGAAPKSVTITSNPPGLSVIVDGATITTPQAFAWKINTTHSLDVPATAQTLNSAVFTYGRWNDSLAASHGITITAGNNTLAQPRTSPAVTVYSANFVQLSAYTATALPSGSVSASPAPLAYPGVPGSYFVARQAVTLTPAGPAGYQFLTWGGTSAPFSASPKPDIVPDNGSPYAVAAYFSNKPITTVTTSPPGLYFLVDNTYYYQGPQNFASDFFSDWTAGSTHTITGFSLNQPYSLNSRYLFQSWSDGGALSHQITVPTGASTLTGTWQAQYVPIAYATPGCASTISITPASPDGFYAKGTPVRVTAHPAAGWTFTGWSGDLTGRQAAKSLVVNDEALAVATYDTSVTPLSVSLLLPNRIKAATASATVKIKGKGFTSGSIVFVNNAYRPTTFVSSQEIDVALGSADLTIAGAYPIGVSNFPSGAPCSAYAALPLFVTK